MSLGAQEVSHYDRLLGGVKFGFEFRVLLRFQLLRFWFWARVGFGAGFLVLIGFGRFGAGLEFNFKVRSGYLIVIRVKERRD